MYRQYFHHGNGSLRRSRRGRRPIVEDLERRQLLIGIVAHVQKVREAAVAIRGTYIGTN